MGRYADILGHTAVTFRLGLGAGRATIGTSLLTASRSQLLPDKDGTFAMLSDIPAPGATAWGAITGTLSSQTDLQAALDARVLKAGDTMTGLLTVPTLTVSGAAEFQARARIRAAASEPAPTSGEWLILQQLAAAGGGSRIYSYNYGTATYLPVTMQGSNFIWNNASSTIMTLANNGQLDVLGGDLTTTNHVIGKAGYFRGAATVAVLANDSGAGTVYLRPNGWSSDVGQTIVQSSGNLTASGQITSGGNLISSGGTVQAGSSAGTYMQLRYDGAISLSGGLFAPIGRVFVQSGDPGSAAPDNSLWAW